MRHKKATVPSTTHLIHVETTRIVGGLSAQSWVRQLISFAIDAWQTHNHVTQRDILLNALISSQTPEKLSIQSLMTKYFKKLRDQVSLKEYQHWNLFALWLSCVLFTNSLWKHPLIVGRNAHFHGTNMHTPHAVQRVLNQSSETKSYSTHRLPIL